MSVEITTWNDRIAAIRSFSYGLLFSYTNPVSTQWGYLSIIKTLEHKSTVLDIGCGDGIYFTNPEVQEELKAKQFQIHCIDVDAHAIEICRKRVQDAGLSHLISVECISVELVTTKYDYTIWMESFPVIELQLFSRLFKYGVSITKKKCLLYHNLLDKPSRFMSIVKPIIAYFTLVDFGRATTVVEMHSIMAKLTPNKFVIKELLSCKFYEMLHPGGKWVWKFVPYLMKQECTQYLITVDPNAELDTV